MTVLPLSVTAPARAREVRASFGGVAFPKESSASSRASAKVLIKTATSILTCCDEDGDMQLSLKDDNMMMAISQDDIPSLNDIIKQW